jgi:hypothetical protein
MDRASVLTRRSNCASFQLHNVLACCGARFSTCEAFLRQSCGCSGGGRVLGWSWCGSLGTDRDGALRTCLIAVRLTELPRGGATRTGEVRREAGGRRCGVIRSIKWSFVPGVTTDQKPIVSPRVLGVAPRLIVGAEKTRPISSANGEHRGPTVFWLPPDHVRFRRQDLAFALLWTARAQGQEAGAPGCHCLPGQDWRVCTAHPASPSSGHE